MWVTTLRQKYRMLTTCPLSIARQNCSPLWRALANIWNNFQDNILWLVGDGNDLHLWNDTWVPNVGPLRPWLSHASPSIDQLHFADMLQADGNWNVSRLSELLDQAIVPHVLGVLLSSFADARDTVAWRHTPTGTFTVASAYEGFLSTSWDACDPKWSCIWSLPIAQRVRMFLWLVLRQRLMTNVERVRRGLSTDPSYSSCGCYNETILHILRDCPPVCSCWQSIIPQADYAAVSLPDHWDRLVVYFVGRLVTSYVAILAFSMGVSRVQLQYDSSVAIRLILDPMAASSTSSLVHRISSLQNRTWLLRFLWVPREMNTVVDGLSKLLSLNDFQLQIFDDISELIQPLLARDHEGPSYRQRR
ncbi:hypothetical protein V6N11_043180 [Hibiscus sabdariffa]|uniref:Reverse transcriptase zinc-binding domain-containing protein n=1 Tax=Hibiscus sabdariffa TaxID=183260 RepID=A0ABR2QYL5_9ROSI